MALTIEGGYAPMVLNPSQGKNRYQGSHFHLVPECFVQLQGTSQLQMEHEREASVPLQPSTMVLIPSGVSHAERIAPSATNIVAKIIDNRLCYHCSLGDAQYRPTRLLGEIVPLLKYRSTAGLLEDIAEQYVSISYLSLIFRQLAEELTLAADPGGGSDILARCQDQVEHRLHEQHLSVAGLASELGCHPDHLSRLAKTSWGMPLVRWITERRLLRARAMLATPTRSIADIARACGFSDSRYFARVFSQAHNCSPSAWRNQMTPKQPPTKFTIPD